MFRVSISRPVKKNVDTLTYAGLVNTMWQEAFLSCTCGWRDKSYASDALAQATAHADRHILLGHPTDIVGA